MWRWVKVFVAEKPSGEAVPPIFTGKGIERPRLFFGVGGFAVPGQPLVPAKWSYPQSTQVLSPPMFFSPLTAICGQNRHPLTVTHTLVFDGYLGGGAGGWKKHFATGH